MKYLKLFESFSNTILYRGTTEDDVTPFDYVFATENLKFAEYYGKVYELDVDLGNIFDSYKLEHLQLLYDAFLLLS